MSILHLERNAPQLASVIQNSRYERIMPNRTATGTAFSNGNIEFDYGHSDWHIPSKTFLCARTSLTKSDGTTALVVQDGVAYSMNPIGNILNTAEVLLNGDVWNRADTYIPQLDAIKTRQTKSRAWLESVGLNNEWDVSLAERVSRVSSDGKKDIWDKVGYVDLGMTGAETFDYTSATGAFLYAGTVNLTTVFAVGDMVEFSDGTDSYREYVRAVSATTLTIDKAIRADIGAPVALTTVLLKRVRARNSRRAGIREYVYQPPLPYFDYSGALPAGNWKLRLNPQSTSTFQKMAIESYVNKTAGTDFKFNVDDIFLMVQYIDAPAPADGTVYIPMDNLDCKTDNYPSTTGLTSKMFDCEPSTYAITVAYQDDRVGGNDSSKSSSKLTINGSSNNELKLNKFYIQYATQTLPPYHADPSLTTNTDLTTLMYNDSLINNGLYFNSGGCETIEEFHERGSYYTYKFLKPLTDRSTRLTVYSGFSSAVDNVKILVFTHSKSVGVITIKNGVAVHGVVQPL